MGTVGTFETFTTARLGIYAAQKGLSVTGNNIANLNTVGYTRQRVDQVSLKTGGNDLYRSQFDNHVGNGALITGISQIRDPYLDIRYRNTAADVGFYDTKLARLQDLQDILDEVGKGVDGSEDGMLYAQLQDIAKSLRELSAHPNKDNDLLVRTSADAMVRLFHTYADKLEALRANTEFGLTQDVAKVNEMLTNIRNLNVNIRECDIHGDPALELRDERNRQIDALSEYMHIDVTYSMERVGPGQEIEKLTISLANDNPDKLVTTDSSVLIDGIFGTQIDIPKTLPKVNEAFDIAKGSNPYKEGPLDPQDYMYLKADGTGTNDPAEAEQLDNTNYIVTLGKLLDAEGREWTSSTTTWEKIPPEKEGAPASFTFQVSASGLEKGDRFTVGGQVFRVGSDISVEEANDGKQLAAFLEKNLRSLSYKISAVGDTLTYEARYPGEVGSQGPAAEPNLAPAIISKKDENAAFDLTLDLNTANQGTDAELPEPNPDTSIAADGTETSVSYVASKGNYSAITTVTRHTYPVTLDDNDLHGSLQATREMLTEQGEFSTAADVDVDENATIKRGIPYYQRSLDLLALQFANHYNSLNEGYMFNEKGNYIDSNGNELKFADGSTVSATKGLTDDQKQALVDAHIVDKNGDPDLNQWLKNAGAKVPDGVGVLFSNRGDGDKTGNPLDPNDPDNPGITAANISISHSWSTGDTSIVTTFQQLFGEDGKPLPNTTQGENVDHMLTLVDKSLVYDPKDLVPDAVGSKLFNGSFNDMLSNMCTKLGEDKRSTNVDLNSHYTTLIEIDTSRDGVSGVDLNDEAMNMMQFQKAYSAACRLMTAIDEALDRLINNTGIAGR